jgi:5-methyltetrahydrofolate--homocysteine methyltransferase
MATLDDIKQNVIDGDAPSAEGGVRKALDEGLGPEAILHQALIPAMAEVGDRFERQEFFVPEMLIAARAMQTGLNVIKPMLAESGVEPLGRVVVGTVSGDLHDIGKNLVAMMLEGAGFEVTDLGVDAAPDKFVEAAKGADANIIGMSALLTTTMGNMKGVIDALAEAGLRDRVKVIIGGAPVNQAYADEIGADGYAADASSAANLARSLMGK